MFFTQPSAELKSMSPFDLSVKRWAVIERELETPWFQMSLRMIEGCFEFARTLLIADVEQLANMLEALPAETIMSVMVMTPPSLSGSKLWQMEHLLAVDEEPSSTQRQALITLTTDTRCYVLPASRMSCTQRLYTFSD